MKIQSFKAHTLSFMLFVLIFSCRKAGALSDSEAPEVYKVRPLVAKNGDLVTVRGNNFNEELSLIFGDKPLNDVRVIDSQLLEGRMPQVERRGKGDLVLSLKGKELRTEMYYAGEQGDYPIITSAPSMVCAGDKFYDAEGQLQVGTRSCDKALCSSDGEVGCVVEGKYAAVNKEDLSSKVATGQTVAGVSGSAPVVSSGSSVCGYSDQASCEVDTVCLWVSGACSLDPWNIRVGKTISGVTGQLKTSCRNRANSTIFNSDALPGTTGTTAGVTIDWWDTIDDYNGNGAFPNATVSGWANATDCDRNVWRDLTADGACDSAGDDCLIQDRISGLIWSESNPVTGSAASGTAKTWSAAVAQCDSLVFGGYSDWRLATQKELQEASVHGIRSVGYSGSGTVRGVGSLDNNSEFLMDTDTAFWSASSLSTNSANAWYIFLLNGTATSNAKSSTYQVLCVRP